VASILLYCRGLAFWLPPLLLGLLGLMVLKEPWASALILLSGALAWLFRRPIRRPSPRPLAVLSPADGRVTGIDGIYDPFTERSCTRVSICMGVLGPFTTRGPTAGRVLRSARLEDLAGALADDASAGGAAGWIETDEGERIGIVFRRPRRLFGPVCAPHVGERLGQGQICGCIPWGGSVDILLPPDARVRVAVGDRVRGGIEVLALLSRSAEEG